MKSRHKNQTSFDLFNQHLDVKLVILILSVLALTILQTSSLSLHAKENNSETSPENQVEVIVEFSEQGNEWEKAADLADQLDTKVTHVFEHVFHGCALSVSEKHVQTLLQKGDQDVEFIEQDRKVNAIKPVDTGTEATEGSEQDDKRDKPKYPELRENQKEPIANQRIRANETSATGKGVNVAVLDTGVDYDHPDLKDNIVKGKKTATEMVKKAVNFVKENVFGMKIESEIPEWNDENGHGTHVAGAIAAQDNDIGVVGVAPEADLYPVKVLGANGGGSMSDIVDGIDWVANTDAHENIDLVNMSLGGASLPGPSSEGKAIKRATNRGVTFIVAAGNSTKKTQKKFLWSTPAAFSDTITVSALGDTDGQPGGKGPDWSWKLPLGRFNRKIIRQRDDEFAGFSNYGHVVDLIAPGVLNLSTFNKEYIQYERLSGTSMASPITTGAAALLVAEAKEQGKSLSTGQIRRSLYLTGIQAPDQKWPGDSDGMAEPLVNASKAAHGPVKGSILPAGFQTASKDERIQILLKQLDQLVSVMSNGPEKLLKKARRTKRLAQELPSLPKKQHTLKSIVNLLKQLTSAKRQKQKQTPSLMEEANIKRVLATASELLRSLGTRLTRPEAPKN